MASLPLYLVLPGLISFGTSQPVPQTIEIEVHATQLRNTKGDLIFFLWKPTDPGFPDGDRGLPSRKLTVRAEVGKVIFREVPVGTYAISLFHDEKGTGLIDRDLLGFPKLGVGVSGKFAPPAFQKSQFTAAESQRVTLVVHYLM